MATYQHKSIASVALWYSFLNENSWVWLYGCSAVIVMGCMECGYRVIMKTVQVVKRMCMDFCECSLENVFIDSMNKFIKTLHWMNFPKLVFHCNHPYKW